MNYYIFKIFLYEVDPLIWRRFSVPENITFSELHQVIQKVMGWNDEQAHQFRYGKGKSLTNVISNTQEQVAPGDRFEDEEEVVLATFIGRKRLPMRLLYRYDFFDDWTHELVIEEKVTEGGEYKLIEGERACPPDDCGGPFGYREALGCFAEWMDDDYDPEAFDPKTIEL